MGLRKFENFIQSVELGKEVKVFCILYKLIEKDCRQVVKEYEIYKKIIECFQG